MAPMREAASENSWTRVPFGDVVRLSRERSGDTKEDGFDRYIGLEHLEPGDLKIRRWGHIADGTTFTNVFRAGQVLFGKRRAYQRKVAVADFEGVCSGDIYVLESKSTHLLPELLPFICQTDSFFKHAVGTSAGSLSPRTNWESLATYECALPPLSEQERLVEALRAAVSLGEALREVKEQLRLARAALAVKYFADPNDAYRRQCSDLISANTLSLQTGPFGTVLRASAYKDRGHPVINPVDMVDGHIIVDESPRIGDDDWSRLEKYWMKPGDMLLGRKRHMHNLVFVQPEHDGYVVGSDSIRFRVDQRRVDARYFFHLLRSETTQRWLQAQAGGNGTVMPGMNEEIIGRLSVCLPDLSTQSRIAAQFDELENAHKGLVTRGEQAFRIRMALVDTVDKDRVE
jgi:type I restriction enzyme, S subunit